MRLFHDRTLGLRHLDHAIWILGKLAIRPVRGEVKALLAASTAAALLASSHCGNLPAGLQEGCPGLWALIVTGSVGSAAAVTLPSCMKRSAQLLLPVLVTVEDILHVRTSAVATMVALGTSLVASMYLLHERALLLCHLRKLFRFLSKLVVEPL